jgi:hypothetical protein
MRYFIVIIIVLLSIKAKAQSSEDVIICQVPMVASYPGGDASLNRFIADKFIQPDTVPDSSFCKNGKIKFTIDKNGLLKQFEIREPLGYGCDEEIIRILKLTKWHPAKSAGKKVEDYRLLPYSIIFEKSEPVNSNTSPRSEHACPPQMPSVISG